MNRKDSSYPSLNNFNETFHSSSNDHDESALNENSNAIRASNSDLNLHHMGFPQMANANSRPSELIAGLGADFAFLWETSRDPETSISPNVNVNVNNLLPDRIVLRAASTDLLTLVQAYDWPATLQRIAMHPSEASTIGIQGRTPLHVACDQDAPALVIKALLAANKSAATKVGTSNMTPLHITCSSQHASVEVVQVLLDGVDECDVIRFTGMKDVDGDTALHASCRCNSPIEVLEVLLMANPSTVHERDFEGLTPLLRLWVRYFVMLKIDLDAVTGIEAIDGELGEGWWEKKRFCSLELPTTEVLIVIVMKKRKGKEIMQRIVSVRERTKSYKQVIMRQVGKRILRPPTLLELENKRRKNLLHLGVIASMKVNQMSRQSQLLSSFIPYTQLPLSIVPALS